MDTSVTAAGPTRPTERIAALDIIRGFALFGILVVNMGWYRDTVYLATAGGSGAATPLDAAVLFLITWLFESKFYSLFSFLFGIGVAIQAARSQARGEPFAPRAVRRFGALLLIGLVHAFFIWVGDILVTYALLGMVLLLFMRRSVRALLIWAVVLLAFMPLLLAISNGLLLLAQGVPGVAAEIEQGYAATAASLEARDAAARLVYADGSFAQITAQRARDLAFLYPSLIFVAPSVLAMFLLGLAAARAGIATDLAAHRPLIGRAMVYGLGVGLVANLIYAIGGGSGALSDPGLAALLPALGMAIGAPTLAIGYAATLVRLAEHPAWRRPLSVLAPVGRMALTNYLLQSIICTLIFYGYGFGLFGRLGPAAGLLLTIAIYGAQIPFSHWWLARFQYGPVEWLWRALTYGTPPPMRGRALAAK